MRGDVVREHAIVITVKVPARGDAVTLRLENIADPQKPVVLGTISRASLLAAVAVTTPQDDDKKNNRTEKQRKVR